MERKPPLPTVSTRSVRPVLERLRALGLDAGAAAAVAGLTLPALDDPDGRIPHPLALAFWNEAVRTSGDDAFGIHVAEEVRPGAFDVLDYATRTSATLGAGLERLVRYHRLLHDAAVLELRVDGDRAQLSHRLPADPVLPRHVAEFIVAAWLVVARQATGVHLVPVEASFRHAPPGDLSEHRRFFAAPVRFGQSANALVFSRAELDLPLIAAEPALTAVLERHMRALAARMPAVESLTARVRQIIAAALPEALGADAVAGRLRMSRRTLQRQLAVEGTTFREVLEGLRRELATGYLRERELAVAEVAFLLGFSEASAFHRAFRRWNGATPTAFRAR